MSRDRDSIYIILYLILSDTVYGFFLLQLYLQLTIYHNCQSQSNLLVWLIILTCFSLEISETIEYRFWCPASTMEVYKIYTDSIRWVVKIYGQGWICILDNNFFRTHPLWSKPIRWSHTLDTSLFCDPHPPPCLKLWLLPCSLLANTEKIGIFYKTSLPAYTVVCSYCIMQI